MTFITGFFAHAKPAVLIWIATCSFLSLNDHATTSRTGSGISFCAISRMVLIFGELASCCGIDGVEAIAGDAHDKRAKVDRRNNIGSTHFTKTCAVF